MAARIMHYSPQMVEETQRLLDLMGVPWVTAAAEGEAQAAVMAAKGQLGGSPPRTGMLLYGSPVFVRNLMDDGTKRYGRGPRPIHRFERDACEQRTQSRATGGPRHHDRHRLPPGHQGHRTQDRLETHQKHGTLEAVCEAKEKEVPERLAEIREIFLNHPAVDVEEADLKQGQVDRAGLVQLQEERQFSQRRMDQAFEKLKEGGYLRRRSNLAVFV